MIDDVINSSYYCLRSIRDAERHKDFKEVMESDLNRASGYLDFLQREAPLLYNSLLPEYMKVANKLYISLDVIK